MSTISTNPPSIDPTKRASFSDCNSSYFFWSLETSSLKVFSASSAAAVLVSTISWSSETSMAWYFSISSFCSSLQRSKLAGEQDGPKFSSAHFFKSAYDRPPSYESPVAAVASVKYLMVGYPLTPILEQRSLESSLVQSTSAITAVDDSAKSFVSFSQSGFIFLQCPHQGARNLTSADLPATAPSKVASLSSRPEAATTRAAKRTTLENMPM